MTRPRISSRQLPGEHRRRPRVSLQPVTDPLLEAADVRIFPFHAFNLPLYTLFSSGFQEEIFVGSTKKAETPGADLSDRRPGRIAGDKGRSEAGRILPEWAADGDVFFTVLWVLIAL